MTGASSDKVEEPVRVEARGSSMEPAIRGGRIVEIDPADRRARRGDVVLVRSGSGALRLHRVVRRRPDGAIVTRGDGSRGDDPASPGDEIVGFARDIPARSWGGALRAWWAPVWAECATPTAAGLEGAWSARYMDRREIREALRERAAGLEPWEERFARRLPAGARVLDVGCGAGREAIALARLGMRIVGIDPIPALLDAARSRAKDAGVDATFLPGDAAALAGREAFPPGGDFDGVLLTRGLYSFLPLRSRRVRLLASLRRRLRPGGTLALHAFEAPPRPTPRATIVRLARAILSSAAPRRFRWERGDRLLRYVTGSGLGGGWVFCHVFRPGGIAAEMDRAGFGKVERIAGGYLGSR